MLENCKMIFLTNNHTILETPTSLQITGFFQSLFLVNFDNNLPRIKNLIQYEFTLPDF